MLCVIHIVTKGVTRSHSEKHERSTMRITAIAVGKTPIGNREADLEVEKNNLLFKNFREEERPRSVKKLALYRCRRHQQPSSTASIAVLHTCIEQADEDTLVIWVQFHLFSVVTI